MKRQGNLLTELTSFSSLYRAWRKAQKGTGWNVETQRFNFNLEQELLTIQHQLLEGSYQPGAFRYFSIRDPKPRQIAVAPFRDRVVHHALVNVLTPLFEPTFIYHSYATRVGKGTHKAIIQAQEFCRRYPWYYKFDVKNFFASVDHAVMLSLIERKLKDDSVLALSEAIIGNTQGHKGLPIGNLTSQFFANVYLNPLDHFIKDNLRVKGYLRYMDDFVLFSEQKSDLMIWHDKLDSFLARELALVLKQKACWLNRSEAGLSFLGMRILPGMIRHCPANRQRSLKKIQQRIKAFEQGRMSEQKMSQSLQCIHAHLSYF